MWFVGKVFRAAMTVAMSLVAIILGIALWHYYMVDPWTRDGTVRAEVVALAPEVSGTVVDIRVRDNQFVHKGDVLYVIDPTRFQLAVAQAQAVAESRKQDMLVVQQQAARRAALTDLAASKEEKEQYRGNAAVAVANYNEALAEVDVAKINLERSVIHAPVNGYVTNLLLRQGDYATAGQKTVSVIDSDSFWIAGYFEETKLGQIHRGDVAHIKLMGFDGDVVGHVDSLARGITDQNDDSGEEGLATVNPVFTWVRLAQRFPVRIRVDQVPAGVDLSMGMTCTVKIGDQHTNLRESVAQVTAAAQTTLAALWSSSVSAVQASTIAK
jgi:multidrug resistance efflux pump